MMEKKIALTEVLGCKYSEVEVSRYDDCTFEAEGGDYLVLTEEERDEKVKEHIEQSVWAFNSSFLASQTDLPEEVFKALQDKCEDGNEAVLSLIEKTCGLDDFVEEAVSCDGYGHFLSTYDGNEEETEVEGETYYVYRTN